MKAERALEWPRNNFLILVGICLWVVAYLCSHAAVL